jgi:cysteine-rich repeat protein
VPFSFRHAFLPRTSVDDTPLPPLGDRVNPVCSTDDALSSEKEDHPSTDTSSHTTRKKLIMGSLTGGSVLLFVLAGFTYSFLRGGIQRGEEVIIPTLALEQIQLRDADFSARLIGEQQGVEIHFFTAAEAGAGFTALASKHNLFDCPAETTPSIGVNVAHGDRRSFAENRAWGYEYSGGESANRAEGRTGLALFDGRFWLSGGELAITADQYGYLNTLTEMTAGKRYYLMSEIDLRVSCLDSDRDGLNNGREDMDGDGVVDEGESDPNDPLDDPAPAVCGDGDRGPGEECDDANTDSEDGCSDACAVETGSERPSVCMPVVPELVEEE